MGNILINIVCVWTFSIRSFRLQHGKNLIKNPEEDEGQHRDEQRTAQALFKGFHAVGNDGQLVIHIPGKSQRKRLAADDHVPPHHEDPEKHQQKRRD
jgi:hypothetical protein